MNWIKLSVYSRDKVNNKVKVNGWKGKNTDLDHKSGFSKNGLLLSTELFSLREMYKYKFYMLILVSQVSITSNSYRKKHSMYSLIGLSGDAAELFHLISFLGV